MAITDPEAIKFVNEEIRPLCEQMRALKVRIDSATTSWYAGLNTTITNDSSAVDDGREVEGISRLTGADVNSAMGVLIGMLAGTTAYNSEVIEKPTVRPIQVN